MDKNETYMHVAESFAKLSKCTRAKVGAILVTSNGVLLPGVNGGVAGGSNDCENVDVLTGELTTKATTLHAEQNCILKAAREGVSTIGSTLYVTLSPCLSCSAQLIAAGVKHVYYSKNYSDKSGIDYLRNNKVSVDKI